MSSAHNMQVGQAGEEAVALYLSKRGFKVIERNWYAEQWGELDIVAVKNQTLYFIEVKARLSNQFGNPEEAVTRSKQAALKRTALFYSQTHPELPEAFQVDVYSVILDPVTLELKEIELFEDAVRC